MLTLRSGFMLFFTLSDLVLSLVKTCGEPTVPEFAELESCTDDYSFESVCIYRCVMGYGMATNASRSILCTANDTWDGTISECLGANC